MRRRRPTAEEPEATVLDTGMALIRTGTGPELLLLPGLSADHALPEGTERAFQVRQLRPFAERHEVWWVNRRAGLPVGTTIAQLADDYARVVRDRMHPPVDVVALSTGAPIALRLALAHPELVRRLVVAGAARLSAPGRRHEQAVLDDLRAGRPRRAAARLFATMAGSAPTRLLLALAGALVGRRMYGGDVADLLVTAEAELQEDAEGELHRLTAPTLVVGGARDRFYGPRRFAGTAARLPHGALLLLARAGHLAALSSPRFHEAALAFLDDRPLRTRVRRHRWQRRPARAAA